MRGILWRIADTPFGVFGYLDLFDGAGQRLARFCTAEEEWRDNRPHISCIPTGSYRCRRGVFPRMGETFEVTGVPGRTAILFHAGNTEADTEGCILLGQRFGCLTVPDEDAPDHPGTVTWAVAESRRAVSWFRGLTKDVTEFPLAVRWSPPGAWRTAPDVLLPVPPA